MSFIQSTFVTVLIFLFSTNLSAQSYYDFPLENSQWTNRHRQYEFIEPMFPTVTLEWYNNFCATGADTTINTIAFKQIDLCDAYSSHYHGALRYDVGQVYFVPKDSINEYLLYDFTLNSQDTANILFMQSTSSGLNPSYFLQEVIIQSVDTIIVNGTSRRRLDTSGPAWIEGIGNTFGLFMEPWENVSGYINDLVCVTENDTIVYDGSPLEIGIQGSCGLVASSLEKDNFNAISISPNPASSFINIKNNSIKEGTLKISTLTGEIVHTQLLQGQKNEQVPLENFVEGVYLLTIEIENSYSTERFVVTK